MNKLLIITLISWLTFPSTLKSQDTLYINPQNSSDANRDGSKEHPFINFAEISIANNTTYLIKRGTTMEEGNISFRSVANVKIGAYGEGNIPLINSGSVIINGCNGFTIEDIEIYSEGSYCLRFHQDYTNENIVVRNCILHSGNWDPNDYQFGLTGRMTGMLVENTEIYNIYRDGVYLDDCDDITFRGCYIHDVNQIYFDNIDGSDGDAIQVLGTTGLTVQNCLIDRSTTGKKFGLILTENSDGAIIEDNIFIGPMKTDEGGANLFLTGVNQTVRRNIFRDAPAGIYSHASSPQINGNQFMHLNEGIYIASNEGLIYHNTFYDNEIGIYSWLRESIIKNNVAYLTNSSQEAFHVADVTFSNNLQNIEGVSSYNNVTIADPMFQDVANRDFHLQAESPCIDAGTDVGINYDYDKNAIPCNGIPDIGAFEDQTGCAATENHRPVANAGNDVSIKSQQNVQLDGSASYDEDEDSLYFRWTADEAIELQEANSTTPYFIAPDVESTENFTITLVVNDGELKSEPDNLIATVAPLGTNIENDNGQKQQFSSYPTPASNYLNIKNNNLELTETVQIQIYTIRGSKILERNRFNWHQEETIQVPLNSLDPGIYFFIIKTPTKIIWQDRFIKVVR